MFINLDKIYFCLVLLTLSFSFRINAQNHPKTDTNTKALFVAPQNGYVTDSEIFFFLVRAREGKNPPQHWIKNLGNGWYIIKNQLANKNSSKSAHLHHFSEIYPANHYWKLENTLFEQYRAKAISYPIECQLWLDAAVESVPQAGYEYNDSYIYPVKKVVAENQDQLENFLKNERVLHLSRYTPRIALPESSVQRFDAGANGIGLTHRWFPKTSGKGLTVSIRENRFDTADVDLKNRWFLTSYSPQTTDLHATEISSLAAGSGNSGRLGKGVAHGAKLTSASFEELLPEPPSYYKNNRISVQNHSYGTGIENEYAADAASYDLLAWLDTGLLHVFSAGNRGNGTSATGTYKGISGFANLTGSFKMSKNSLSVGATDSFHRVENLSSRGPAYDGRIKPEIVAFGIDGTSGAAALTSGAALLVQQAIRDKTGLLPASSLVKALLIGTAQDLGTEGPDFASGFGRLDVFRAVLAANNLNFFTGVASAQSPKSYTLTLPAQARNLKITLVWTDTASTPSSASALVNDLDLSLKHSPSGETWLPWILSHFPHADSLKKPAKRGIDRLNNIEQVSLANPAAGAYIITVSPFAVSTQSQPFALVYSFDTADTLTCTYPAATDPVTAASDIPIRWQQTFPTGTKLKMEYSLNQQNNWQTIALAADASDQYHYWRVPDTNALARIRFTVGGKTFFSDSVWITGNPAPKPGYVCEDGALLVWKPLKGVAGYRIFTLGDTLMEPAGTTMDTTFFIPAARLKNQWVTISAFSPAPYGLENRFPSFNIFSQGTGCYFKSFIAEWNNGETNLDILLGTNYGIQSLTIQKSTGGAFTNLQTINPVSGTVFSYTDKPLTAGAHTYQVLLKLLDGSVIESELQTIIQPGSGGWWVYPNPVKRGTPLKILNRWSETEDLFVTIYDVQGRKAGHFLVPLIDNTIPVTNLAAGVYFLVFTNGKNQIGSQKLWVTP